MSILSKSPPRTAWAPTRWSMVAGLEQGDPDPEDNWEPSWQYLVETYLEPMKRYVRRVLSRCRGRPVSDEEVQDLVQDFLTTCLEKEWLSRADPLKGRFRAYIQHLLKRYVYSWIRHETAQRRKPRDGQVVSFDDDFDPADPSSEAQEAQEFDRGWVEIAIERALLRLREENERNHAVISDLLATDGEGSPDLAERLGVRREQLPVIRHRARARFSALFEEELAQTVGDPEAFDEEWRALSAFLP